jgi:FkbM family methyltransferase
VAGGNVRDTSALSTQDRLRVRLIAAAGLLTKPLHHRGLWRLCRLIGGEDEGSDARRVVVTLSEDSQFAFDLGDPYWARLLGSGFVYEPEVDGVLRAFADVPYTFVDAGANLGYWSVLVSSSEFGAHRTIAIEAASQTFERLLGNCALNGRRFECVRGAVSEAAGRTVTFAISAHHAGSGIADSGEIRRVRGTEVVPTLTLDEVVAERDVAGDRLIVKLDVEGAEVAALHGARKLLEGDALVLYEDHGKDPEARVSAAAIELGWTVLLPSRQGFVPADLAAIRRYKRRPDVGYNLIACRAGSPMHAELRARIGGRATLGRLLPRAASDSGPGTAGTPRQGAR